MRLDHHLLICWDVVTLQLKWRNQEVNRVQGTTEHKATKLKRIENTSKMSKPQIAGRNTPYSRYVYLPALTSASGMRTISPLTRSTDDKALGQRLVVAENFRRYRYWRDDY